MDIDPMQLLQCTRDALVITRQTTQIIRRAWDQKQSSPLLSSLAMTAQASLQQQEGLAANNRGAQDFIDNLSSTLAQAGSDSKSKQEK